MLSLLLCFFLFTYSATTKIYTLSLHDALPILMLSACGGGTETPTPAAGSSGGAEATATDRKSTRLNSSHPSISYAAFCSKKKIDGTNVDENKGHVLLKNPVCTLYHYLQMASHL